MSSHQFLNKNDFLPRRTHCLICDSNQFTNRLCGVKVSENKTDKILSNFRRQNSVNLTSERFSAKVKKRWSVSCYTDWLLANQVAEKPVRISCQ